MSPQARQLTVMTVVGTRPEIIKLSRVMAELDTHVRHVLVHTGQNYDYELNQLFFEELGVRKPDYFLDAAGANPAETIGKVIIAIDRVFAEVHPNALLVLGDTNSALSVIPAKRRKIPIFHMEAGNRCFDSRVPEEINRKIVDHTSDINMTWSEHARRYLLSEGVRPETVFKVGSPMKEVLTHYMPKIESSQVLQRLGLTQGGYFVVSAHREENIESDTNFKDFLDTLTALVEAYHKPLIVTTHPRTRKRLEALGVSQQQPMIQFLKPLGFFDYVALQRQAYCVVSDSGTITEESSILNFPAITIRQAHERPEGVDEGTLIMSGLKSEAVLAAVAVVRAQFEKNPNGLRIIGDYDTVNVSTKVLRIILSYIEYVNRTVWYKI